MRDYPKMIAPTDHVEPAPRRVRAVLAGRTILDTTHARYVWEWPNYPQYYIPLADVDPAVLVDEHQAQGEQRGTAHQHGLIVAGTNRAGAARVYREDAVEGLVDTVRFDWAALDAWFEEDEQVFVHPRNPYTRVDAVRSNRVVRVELDDVVVAETQAPVLVFETGLPTRYYIPESRWTSSTSYPPTPSASALTRARRAPTGQCGWVRRHTPTWRGPTTFRRDIYCRSPEWSPSTTRRSTTSWTANRSNAPQRTSFGERPPQSQNPRICAISQPPPC